MKNNGKGLTELNFILIILIIVLVAIIGYLALRPQVIIQPVTQGPINNPITPTPTLTSPKTPTPVKSKLTAPTISSVSPSSGPAGTEVTIYGSGLAGGVVKFSDSGIFPNSNRGNGTISSSDTQITFVVPNDIGPDCAPNSPCPQYVRLVTAGTYDISVTNNGMTSNTVQFTVTGNNNF